MQKKYAFVHIFYHSKFFIEEFGLEQVYAEDASQLTVIITQKCFVA